MYLWPKWSYIADVYVGQAIHRIKACTLFNKTGAPPPGQARGTKLIMEQNLGKNFLESVVKQFTYYRMLGEKTFEQLPEEALFYKPDPASNSISIIVRHLSGNMLSRWTNFLVEDGEKTWRKRDQEFEEGYKTREEVIEAWNKGWDCLMAALDSLRPEDLLSITYIRNQGHTVLEAINRQLAHYSYHIGQIIYIGKMYNKAEWKSLSIPRGKTLGFNTEMFSKPKEIKHYIDDELI